MKYVRPYALFKQIEKMNMELAQKKALRVHLLGVDVLDDGVSLAISNELKRSIPKFCLDRNKANIHTIANEFQTLIMSEDLEGIVVGFPDDKSKENCNVANVLGFVNDLCNTQKLEGFKYTYWDMEFKQKRSVYCSASVNSADSVLKDYLRHSGRKEKYLDSGRGEA